MSNYIDGIIVVEGTGDASLISSFIDSEIVVTNGFELDTQTIDYLKIQETNKKIYILTDPDDAGLQIRNKLHHYLHNFIDVNVSKDKCNKHNKHGVAECEIEEIKRALSPYFSQKPIILNKIDINDLYELNLIGVGSNYKRDKISKAFNLGKCNGKKLLERLNSLNVKLDDLKKVLEE